MQGTVLGGRFEVTAALGAGGSSDVFRARDRETEGNVAVKVLRDSRPHVLARLGREAQLLASLEHPAIVRILAAGIDHTPPYLVLEWLEGADLAHLLKTRTLSVLEAFRLIVPVAEGLAYAHARGVVHRDIKPSNLFLVGGVLEAVKLLDFGIARWDEDATLTHAGATLGTPAYMAPEQIRDAGQVGPAADVFGLGCVLFECLTGVRAFGGDGLLGAMARVLMDEPRPPSAFVRDVPPAIDALVSRMLVKDPRERLADGGALLHAIDQAMAGLVVMPSRAGLSTEEQRLISVILVGSQDDDDAVTVPDDHWTPTTADLFGERFHVDRLRGGALVASFRGRSSALDDVYRAASTALALHRRYPTLPIAIATGRSHSGALAVGPVIDRAAELVARAHGAVRIDDGTAALLDPRFAIGVDQHGHVLLDARPALTQGRPVLGVATPFVGRSRDLGVLELMFEDLVEQHAAQAVVIVGDAGIGKSRLASEFVARAQGRMELDVWLGDARLDDQQPYATISRCVRRSLNLQPADTLEDAERKIVAQARRLFGNDPDRAAFLAELAGAPIAAGTSPRLTAARGDPEIMGEQLVAVWEDYLAATVARRAVVLVLEDLHWADEPSLRLVARSLQLHRASRLFVLGLSRPEGLQRFPAPLGRQIQTVALRGLHRGAQELLVRAVLPSLDADALASLVQRADGNAFFLEELIRARELDGEKAPDSVLAVLEQRLDALPAQTRQVLRAGAVFGSRFSRRAVIALLPDVIDADAQRELDALVNAELVVSVSRATRHDREYEFHHALARDAAYASLTSVDRALGHRLAADFLAGGLEGLAEPSTVAYHLERGEQPERAAPWYSRAANRALAAGDLGACIAYCHRALAHASDGDLRAEAFALKSTAHMLRAEYEQAATEARAGMEMGVAGSDRWCALASELVRATTRMGSDASVIVDQLVTACRPEPTTAWAQALAQVAYNLRAGRQEARARGVLDLVEQRLPPQIAHDPKTSALLASARALIVQGEGAHDLAADLLGHAMNYFDAIGDRPRATNAKANLAGLYLTLGQLPRATELALAAVDVAEAKEWPGIREYARSIAALTVAIQGDLDRALELQTTAIEALRHATYPRMLGKLHEDRARVRLLAGDREGAELDALAGAKLATPGTTDHARAHARLAQALLAVGRIAEAIEYATAAIALRDQMGLMHDYEGDLVGLVHAEALEAADRHPEATAAIVRAHARLLERVQRVRLEYRTGILALPESTRIVTLARSWRMA